MEATGRTLCTQDIQMDESDGWIDLKQFKVGQIIEHTNGQQSWMIVAVRKDWLKVKPLFDCYEGDPRKHVRFDRMHVDMAFYQGWWRIRRNYNEKNSRSSDHIGASDNHSRM